jgi:uncharacterized membrane protein YobD (UPF0266 family)
MKNPPYVDSIFLCLFLLATLLTATKSFYFHSVYNFYTKIRTAELSFDFVNQNSVTGIIFIRA